MDFEKLDVWKRSASLSAELYTQLRTLNDYGFKVQITRSRLSVPSNIAEGMPRQTSKDKLRFLSIAKGSCSEQRTQIYIGMKVGYIEAEKGKSWLTETREIASMISGLTKKLQDSN